MRGVASQSPSICCNIEHRLKRGEHSFYKTNSAATATALKDMVDSGVPRSTASLHGSRAISSFGR